MAIDPKDIIAAFDLEPEKAEEFLRGKGYAITWSWKEMQSEAHRRAFTVAKAVKMDVLLSIRDALESAQAKGTSFQEFKKQLEPTLRAKGWWGMGEQKNPETGKTERVQLGSPWRLETIYRTNLQSAYMAGRQQEQQAVATQRPYWQLIAVSDGRTTDVCSGQNGKVYRAVDLIWGRLYPPNHHRCRSRVRTLSEKQLKREKLSVDDGSESEWQPAPGFTSSPIVPWTPDLSRVPAPLARQVQADLEVLQQQVGLSYAPRTTIREARQWMEDHVADTVTFDNPYDVNIEDKAQLQTLNQINSSYARLTRINPNLGKLRELKLTAADYGMGSGGMYIFTPHDPDQLGQIEITYIPRLEWLDLYQQYVDQRIADGSWFKISNNVGDTFRHEFGHHLHATQFENIRNYTSRVVPDVFDTEADMQAAISQYSATRYRNILPDQYVEAVAEGVAMVTKDGYVRGTLPEEFEEWLYQLIRGEFQ